MSRPEYLSKYLFNWEVFDVVISGRSALDSRFLVMKDFDKDNVTSFLKGYGLDPSDPVSRAELFGNFQEALQFVRRYFLKEGNPDGIDLKIPNSLYMITDISDLFILASKGGESSKEESLWAEVILKVMHTILHVDKDLRSNYFSVIQTQVFDKFYKYLHRDDDQNLFLGDKEKGVSIPLVDFQTKSKKTRDSVIVKLLHKAENVAEELFDRIGVRIVTRNRFETLQAVKFLVESNIIIPHNIKPSRSVNTMIDIEEFKKKYLGVVKMAIRNDLSEERFVQAMNREVLDCLPHDGDSRNDHTSNRYLSIQFTCRQLIKYKNPFLAEFSELRQAAKSAGEDNDLAKKILHMDPSLIARDVRFFYPFEVQVVDVDAHKQNTEGEASHQEYKKNQKKFAMKRLFNDLLIYKNIEI